MLGILILISVDIINEPPQYPLPVANRPGDVGKELVPCKNFSHFKISDK